MRGEWSAAEVEYRAALAEAEAEALGDVPAQVETALAMARIVWQPGALADLVDERCRALVHQVASSGSRAELLACVAGGLYQSGAISSASAAEARTAERHLGDIADRCRRAEALVRVRKGLLGIDPPTIQLRRSVEVAELADGRADLVSHGCLGRIVDHLHLGDVGTAIELIGEHRRLVGRDLEGFVGFQQANLEPVLAGPSVVDAGRLVPRATRRRCRSLRRAGGAARSRSRNPHRPPDRRRGAGVAGTPYPGPRRSRCAPALGRARSVRAWSACGLAHSGVSDALRPRRAGSGGCGVGGAVDSDESVRRHRCWATPTPRARDGRRGRRDVDRTGRRRTGHRESDRAQLRGEHAMGVLLGWPTVYLGESSEYLALAERAGGATIRR